MAISFRKRSITSFSTNPAEFFAVATETFFGKPRQLRAKHPELYQQLQGCYRQDPASLEGM
jgi:Mlc titration factor MtfA (ptsG expression regulator)